MKIGTLGAGEVAQAFAIHLLKAGHEVLLSNSRGPSSLTQLVSKLGKGARAVTMDEAARASIVVLAVPWPKVEAVLGKLPDWEGRILIDATNHFMRVKRDRRERISGHEPYGWDFGADGQLIENGREQKAVALIRQLHGQGKSLRKTSRSNPSQNENSDTGFDFGCRRSVGDCLLILGERQV